MDQPGIEEQLKAIEAAINLAQARHLPAVIPPSQPAVNPNGFDGKDAAKSRELALAILKRFDERIAGIEQEGQAWQQQQAHVEAAQQEHQEAIELISDEVATLKRRTAQMESWLRQMHLKPTVDLYQQQEQQKRRQGFKLLWAIVMGLILIAIFAALKIV